MFSGIIRKHATSCRRWRTSPVPMPGEIHVCCSYRSTNTAIINCPSAPGTTGSGCVPVNVGLNRLQETCLLTRALHSRRDHHAPSAPKSPISWISYQRAVPLMGLKSTPAQRNAGAPTDLPRGTKTVERRVQRTWRQHYSSGYRDIDQKEASIASFGTVPRRPSPPTEQTGLPQTLGPT